MKKIDILNEVYTEKQRRWACWQMDAPKSEREISKLNATEMCKDVKHSKKNVKPKMKKKDLVEYIINKKISLKENTEDIFLVNEISNLDKKEIFKFLNTLKASSVTNMHGTHPILCWTREDLSRWLYGMGKDIESLENKIEELEYSYDYDDEDNEDNNNEGLIERLRMKIDMISYMLDSKDDIRDILIGAAIERAENTSGNTELGNVQRLFEKIAAECWKMWAFTYLKIK